MSLFDALRHRLYVLRRGEHYALELARERAMHLEMEAAAQARDGATLPDARVTARRRFGNPTWYGEEARRMTMLRWIDGARQDLSYAWRGLRRSPAFTVTVVVTLALGLGVNAAMFSLLDRLFARPPKGVVAPEQIRRLYIDGANSREPGARVAFASFKYPSLVAMSAALDSSLRLAALTTVDSVGIVERETRTPARRNLVTAGYFDLLGVRPQLGRFFEGDERVISVYTPVAILSDAFWRRRYGADPSVLGRPITVNTVTYTIIGVAARGFSGIDLNAVDIWAPANTWSSERGDGLPWWETRRNSFRIIGRSLVDDARREDHLLAQATAAHLTVRLPGFHHDSTARIVAGPVLEALGPSDKPQELSISTRLAGVAVIVLIIAIANVANLLLVRATTRRREIALRRALGVSAARLWRQVVTETLVLAALAGTAAILCAYWAASALRRLLLPSVQWADGAIDLRTVAFAGGASVVVGLLAGLAPALQAVRPQLVDALKAGNQESAYRRSRARDGLVVVQVALSVVLLAGAVLFVRSLHNVRALDIGYDPERTVIVRPTFMTPGNRDAEIGEALPRVADRVRTLPGVEAVAYASSGPLSGYSFVPLFLPGRDSLPPLGNETAPSFSAVSGGFIAAAGMRLLAGRDFAPRDRGSMPVLVSETMARHYWPGQNPIGACVHLRARELPCARVIGVFADVRRMNLIEEPTLHFLTLLGAGPDSTPSELVIRAAPEALSRVNEAVTRELKAALPGSALPWVRTVGQRLAYQYHPWRLGATLFTAFGVLALIVAAVGVYSVAAYGVSQRVHEIGVRLALGATGRNVMQLVLSETAVIAGIGITLGIAFALAVGCLVEPLLHGVSPRDPVSIAASAVLLLVVGVAGCLVPAWRATRLDPSRVLRSE